HGRPRRDRLEQALHRLHPRPAPLSNRRGRARRGFAGSGMKARALAVVAALAIALAGCGGSDNGGGSAARVTTVTEAAPQVAVQTAEHGFDAAEVYREASPGVVTIRSVFRGEGGSAEGSGFVLDKSGKIVTNAHVVTDESSGSRKTAKEVFIEFPERNTVPAKIVGFDPFADV